MKERLLFSLTTLLLLCYGCNDEEGSGLTVTEAAAGNAVVSTARTELLVDDPRSVDALISLSRIYTDLTTLATDAGEVGVVGIALTKGTLGDCVVVTDSVIRYDDCPVSNGTIDGTITVDGDELSFDLDIAVVDSGDNASLVVSMEGPVTVTETSLYGSLNYETVIEGLPDFPDGFRLSLEADYVDIGIDDVECPLSGSLRAEQRGLDSNTGVREAIFGPSCGDVRIVE
ncbi:MAG: hypothetical protein AAGF92_24470 [Myxococcota bacterium]